MRIGTSLLILVGAATAPLIAFSVWMGYSTVDDAAVAARIGAVDRARIFMTAVDAEIGGHMSTIAALAASENLREGRLDAFRREAVLIKESQPAWQNVTLSDPSGVMLLDALTNTSGAGPIERRSIEQAASTGRPVVGNVAFRDPPGAFGIALRYPIVRNGKTRYVLSAILSPNVFQDLMKKQNLPDGWVSGLIDSDSRFVARIPPRPHTDVASPAFRQHVATSTEGWYRGSTVEGADTFTAFRRSESSGWSIGVAVPAQQFNAPALRAALLLAGGIALTLLVGWAVAYIIARHITRPASALAEAATSLGSPSAPQLHLAHIRIQELQAIGRALDEASAVLKERDRLVQREQDALRAADRAKNEFLAMLGHELRNPLAAIATSSEILKRTTKTDVGGYDPIPIIIRQTKQMSRLIEDLLDASRLAMGKMTLNIETFDLGEVVRQVTHIWEQAKEGRKGRLQLTVQEAYVKGDRLRTEQILVNLLDNAAKFSPAGTPIRVKVENRNEEAVLSVEDQGRGLSPDALENVFALFVQDTKSPEYAGQGLGIGLALVRGFAELQGGSARAESAGEGKGATFIVTFLRSLSPESRNGIDSNNFIPRNSLRILLVEDSEDGRRAMEELLALDQHEIHSAASGTAALSLMKRFEPEVALVDIGLPDMTGYDVVRALRERFGSGLLIISMSGYGQTEDQQRAVLAGIDTFLTKPVDLEQLNRLMNEWKQRRI
jgi:signal transduction histidine kinase/ActR/RegA family two-component response regulator